MRAEIGDLIMVRGVRRWIYVTDAAEEPESILIGNLVTSVGFIGGNDPVMSFRCLPERVTTDNSIVTGWFDMPFSVEADSVVEYAYGQVEMESQPSS